MKNQKGFTLVELMVVMAIIAILATAGISQYGKFIKGARDTTRIADLNAINIVLLDAVQSKGVVPDNAAALATYVKEVAGKDIVEKLGSTATACLNGTNAATKCGYYYMPCDGGTGYIIATVFESSNNTGKYKADDVSGTSIDDNKYELGSCTAAGTNSTLTTVRTSFDDSTDLIKATTSGTTTSTTTTTTTTP